MNYICSGISPSLGLTVHKCSGHVQAVAAVMLHCDAVRMHRPNLGIDLAYTNVARVMINSVIDAVQHGGSACIRSMKCLGQAYSLKATLQYRLAFITKTSLPLVPVVGHEQKCTSRL